MLLLCLLAPPDARAGAVFEENGETVIRVRSAVLPDPSNPATFARAEAAAVAEFERRFPRIFAERYRARYEADPARYGNRNWERVRVEMEPFTGINVPGVEVDLLAIAGGMAPDILYVNFRKSDNYIRNGFLYPLDRVEDGYLASMSQDEIDFRVHPALWPVLRRKGPDGAEHVWALPWGGALGKVLLFRRDLFDAKGVAHPTAQWTWEDMLDAARRITDPARGIYGMFLTRGKHESWYWVQFLWSAGGEVMEYDPVADTWRCVFGSREAAVALDFYTKLSAERWVDAEGVVRRGYSTKDASNVSGKWERGEIGMMFGYIDERVFSTINPELVGMVPVPLGPGGRRGGELNSRMMGLFSGIRDPAVRDAAWEFMKFYDSEDAARIKTQVMVDGGFGPFINPKYLRAFGYPEIERLSPPGWAKTFEIAMETGRPEPYGRNSNVAYDLMTIPIEQAEQLALRDALPADDEERLDLMQELLERAETRANEIMIGILTPQQRLVRRIAAAVFLAVLLVTFALVFRAVARTFAPQAAGDAPAARWGFRRYAWAYALLLPALLTIAVWQYLPLVQGSAMAFLDYRLIGRSVFVGLDNFGNVLFDSFWWRAVWNSLRYSLLVIALTFLPPLGLAILLQEIPRERLLFRIVFYLPAVMSGIVTIVLWKQFFEPSERGALNFVMMRIPAWAHLATGALLFALALSLARRLWLHDFRLTGWLLALGGAALFVTCSGLAAPILMHRGETLQQALVALPERLFALRAEPYRWLSNPDTAMLSCVLPMVWAGVGPGSLIYLAALKGIPEDYYEAADVDGASFGDKILFIIVPMLRPLLVINFVGVFVHSWYGAEGNILVMTGGAAQTEVAGLHIWYKAFTFLQFGPATAMAWMLAFMLIGFTLYQLRLLARVEFRVAGRE